MPSTTLPRTSPYRVLTTEFICIPPSIGGCCAANVSERSLRTAREGLRPPRLWLQSRGVRVLLVRAFFARLSSTEQARSCVTTITTQPRLPSMKSPALERSDRTESHRNPQSPLPL